MQVLGDCYDYLAVSPIELCPIHFGDLAMFNRKIGNLDEVLLYQGYAFINNTQRFPTLVGSVLLAHARLWPIGLVFT